MGPEDMKKHPEFSAVHRIAEGYTAPEIAELLGISRQSVQQSELPALRALRWPPQARSNGRQKNERQACAATQK